MEITVSRPKQFADRIRAYKIKIDGNKISEIKAGESITISIPENSSIIQANVDWGLSNEMNVSDLSQSDNLTIKNSFSHKLWIPFVAFYYITFARKKYLNISKYS